MGRHPGCFFMFVLIVITMPGVESLRTVLNGEPAKYVDLMESYDGELIYSSDNNAFLNTSVLFIVDNSSTIHLGSDNYSLVSDPVYAGQEIVANDALNSPGNTSIGSAPLPLIAMTISELTSETFEIFIYIKNDNSNGASNVKAVINLEEGLKIDYGTTTYLSVGTDYTLLNGRREFFWNAGNMSVLEQSNDTFTAELDKENMKTTYNFFSLSVTYTQATSPTSQEFGPLVAEVCLEKIVIEKKSVLYQHGFTALAFFMAFILGILLVCLGFFIYYMIRRKKTISPTKVNQEKLMMERGKTIMMDENEAVKKSGHTINDYSVIGEGDSIVGVFGMKDKMQMHRELDSLDIVNTVNVDTNLERERNDASMATTELLLTGLHSNNDINKGTLETALGNLRNRRVHLDRQQDEDYKREMKKLYKKISAKNRAMMNTLMQKQRNEKKELVGNTQDLPAKERNGMINLMNEQHLAEQNAETYRLKLEQDEETEKLRKEFAIRSRMGIKELQIQALNDVKEQGKLSDPQMKWLLAEHQKNQKSLESMYDEEISRQRMNLEEKLARRKALAQSAETLEDNNDDLLNTVAGQQVIAIEKMKKSKCISAADANELIDEAKREMIAIKDKMEKQRADQESSLHKKLSELKKRRLNDLAKEHDMELKEYDRKCKEMQTDGPIDPITYADGRLKLLSQQRVERSNLENEVDTENTNELIKLRSEIAVQTEGELRGVADHLKMKISQDDNAEAMLERLIREHQNETEALRASQKRNRDKQLRKLQDRLEENREQWNQRKEAEKMEQEQLRQYEDNVVSKLVNSQVSMSDAERERILKEHEKQMVKLENSLTLNKLRQKRMVEEKIAQRRAQQMEKLQLKQHKEKETQKRQMENNAEESDDEDVQRKRLELMKEHVEQKMAVLQGRKMDWDTELESIRVEMLKERSLALKEQEERLGALVAELQLSKAKELAKIEEQQRAIHNLKTNLIDDLNARGVLSDPETQAVIKRHQEEQQQLNERLDMQRQQQEKMLKQKLQMRLEQREKSMVQQQDEELKNLMGPNKTASKIKKMLLIHNHMLAMEKMRNQLEREISQTLEQVRYEYEVCKRKAIQDQEMDFIAGLVRVGTIPKEELESVLHMLYPGKSEAEFKEIFEKIFDPRTQAKQGTPLSKEDVSHLVSRVRSAQAHPPPFMRRTSQMSLSGSMSSRTSSLRRSSKKKKDTFAIPHEQQQYYDEDHFEDNSRFRPSSRQFEDVTRFQPPGRQTYDDLQQSRRSSSGRPSFDETQQFRPSSRQSFEDHPHPLESSYSLQGSLRQNGQGYANPIMEEDDDVIQAQYMSGDQKYRQPPPTQLPPLSAGGKKKKKKKFLKKMANSPRHENDDDY
ncbi:trichohyalin-like isoform X2 [Mercenaria mercenaria]|uniref:trichohyalin-like isoform X2 n=1 Tax=Mercenaria mercenaria TaxID=6596 RepID=UPI00234F3390|nr:trichohyalin-like isoform X2 [Mercenaria mercenaria]